MPKADVEGAPTPLAAPPASYLKHSRARRAVRREHAASTDQDHVTLRLGNRTLKLGLEQLALLIAAVFVSSFTFYVVIIREAFDLDDGPPLGRIHSQHMQEI
eukprot:SAG22_NODE_2181_length_2877_cov_2.137509_3_plen_102_part_00